MLLLLATTHLFSQSSVDSLKTIVALGKQDTAMVSTLNALSKKELELENIAQSIKYSEQALKLANELDDIKGKAFALKNLGSAEFYQGNYMKVLEHWTKSKDNFEEARDTIGIANMLNNLGGIYYNLGSSAKALDYFLESLSIAEKLKDPLRIASVLPNIGAIYGSMLNYEKALKYFDQMKPYLATLNNSELTTYYLMGIGEVYKKIKNLDEASKVFEEALLLNENTPENVHILTMLGTIEFDKGNVEKSVSYLNHAYRKAKEKNQQLEIVQVLTELGTVYENNDFAKSIGFYKEAEELAKQIEAKAALRDIYQGMSNTYAVKGDFKNAFQYQKNYLVQKDSLFNLETDDKIRGLQFNFDLEKKEDQIGLLEKEAQISELQVRRQKNAFYVSILISVLIFLLGMGVFNRYKYIKKSHKLINAEKDRSENLLLNILPNETAIELKKFGKVQAKKFESVSVMFTDFKGFTSYSQDLTPEELVKSVDYYFSKFDQIIDKYGLEKIKTIGDAYMCAGGLPFPSNDHPVKIIQAAFEIEQFINETKKNPVEGISSFDIRLGINTGPVVAGVVGIRKFAYDIWGDTVNVASRMESLSEPGRINISEDTYQLIKDNFDCEYRGEIQVKNKGIMKMYFVNSMKSDMFTQVEEKRKIEI